MVKRPLVHRQPKAIHLGAIFGSATGEGERYVVPGGWSGTDDATSTAPSDLSGVSLSPDGTVTVHDVEKRVEDLAGWDQLVDTDEPDVSP